MGAVADSVSTAFSTAQAYATSATAKAEDFINSMESSLFTAPQISVQWTTLAAPTISALPSTPTLPTIEFTDPGTAPPALAAAPDVIVFDEFTEIPPVITLPTAPTVDYGTAPTIPTIADITVPVAPTIGTITAPTLLTLETVTFAGLDLHLDWQAELAAVPTLTLAAPTPFSYSLGAEYSSALLTELQAKLLERLAGGTGLDPIVEQAIWDRGRTRETKIALSNEAEVMRNSEALGFHLPAGVSAAQLREAQANYYDKLSELSRDVMIKQAEMEQANLKDTIAAGMDLEGKLIDYSFKLEQLTFETAKQYADNAIQVHNAAIEQFKTLLQRAQIYAENYKTLINAEELKVQVYKTQIDAESAKADMNKAIVDRYKAEIEATMTQVEIYRAQVGAAQTLMGLEQARISAAGEQVRAYVARINGETAKVEAYKASVQGEQLVLDVYKTKATTWQQIVNVQIEQSRAQLAEYDAKVRSYVAQWDGYRSAVGAETARMDALAKQSGSLLDGYRAAAAAIESKANIETRVWESNMRQYEASVNVTLQTAKINSDAILTTNAARLDAAKVGAQTFAQLASSAYGMAHATTNLTGSINSGVSYNYQGEATIEWPPFDP